MKNPPSIYFYCCPEVGNLQEDIIALAEGFRDLGISFYSNCNYWRESTVDASYLFNKSADVTHQDCDIVIVSYTWPLWVRMKDFRRREQPLPAGLFARGRSWLTIYMDNNDGYKTISWSPQFRNFDVILRSKCNIRAYRPSNIIPWAYGLNQRIMLATRNRIPFEKRKRSLLYNFNASHPFQYGSRSMAQKKLLPHLKKIVTIDKTIDNLLDPPADPYDKLMWQQTGFRYSRSYYNRLLSSQYIASFCGDIIPSRPFSPDKYLVGGRKAFLLKLVYQLLDAISGASSRAVGADSFRFWEGLSAGCVVVNLDLACYGVSMPVMPINGQHYIGIDFSRSIPGQLDILLEDSCQASLIARQGRDWALKNYSPAAVAIRFLEIFGYKETGTRLRPNPC